MGHDIIRVGSVNIHVIWNICHCCMIILKYELSVFGPLPFSLSYVKIEAGYPVQMNQGNAACSFILAFDFTK